MPSIYTGKFPKTSQEYEAERAKLGFLLDVQGHANGLQYLIQVGCYQAVLDSIDLLAARAKTERERLDLVRNKQLEIDGLQPSALKQEEMPV
jgi:hypothetical protein